MNNTSTSYLNFYFLKSRILTHILFWVLYFIFFGYIWAKNEDYYSSYFLEFILLPIRILSVYTMIYWLIPKYIRERKYIQFFLGYAFMLLATGFLQRIFTYYYYETLLAGDGDSLFSFAALARNIILINSTVLLVSAVKIVQLWQREIENNNMLQSQGKITTIEIKSDKRVYRISPTEILYVESLGNYVTYHLKDHKLISYENLGDVSDKLGINFIRVHKSFVVNRFCVSSYNHENVEVFNAKIPIGRAYRSKIKF